MTQGKWTNAGRRCSAAVMCVLVSAGGVAQTAAPAPDAPAPEASQAQNPPSIAQQAQAVSGPIAPFHVELPHSHNPFDTYRASTVAPLNLNNSPRLDQLIRDGKLYLSLRDALALALEDNADLAFFRYNLPIADTDLLRTKAGGQALGVNVGTVQFTAGGFGGGTGGGGGASYSTAGGGAGGLVQSTLGFGPTVHPYDPQLNATGYTDHTTNQLTNVVTTGGVRVYQQNTIEAQAQYVQYFPLGTNLQFNYTGLRHMHCRTISRTAPRRRPWGAIVAFDLSELLAIEPPRGFGRD